MKRKHRRQSQLSRRACWGLIVALATMAASSSADDFPRPVSAPLRTSLRIVVEGKPLGETVADLGARTGLRVWIDRRVDPSRSLSRDGYGPTAGEILEQFADEHDLELAIADEVALLGPPPISERAATEMMAAWDSLVASTTASPDHRTASLAEIRAVRWPILTTPSEALQIVAETWGLQIDGVSLPHDLWPEADLGEVRVTTALGLIGVGFDLALELDPATRRVTARPLRPATPVAREYPWRTLPPPLRSELTSPAVGGQLRKQDDRWALSGPARAHAMLESSLLAAARRPTSNAPGRPAASAEKRFSLRLVNKPADEFLKSLCRSAGWQLEIAPEAAESLAQPIDMQVEQATLDELVERAVTPLSLRAEREGTRLRILPGPK